jgi:hypothetical protein
MRLKMINIKIKYGSMCNPCPELIFVCYSWSLSLPLVLLAGTNHIVRTAHAWICLRCLISDMPVAGYSDPGKVRHRDQQPDADGSCIRGTQNTSGVFPLKRSVQEHRTKPTRRGGEWTAFLALLVPLLLSLRRVFFKLASSWSPVPQEEQICPL